MTTVRDRIPEKYRSVLGEKKDPSWEDPMLATLTKERFSDSDWIYERKLDGERCLAVGDDEGVILFSRSENIISNSYPELVDVLADQQFGSFVADGEIVAFEGSVTSFAKLQHRMHVQSSAEAQKTGVEVYFYLFDLLNLDRHDVTQLPLRTRKALLKSALEFKDPLRYSAHRNRDGERYFGEACSKGWEGLIAKRADSPYRHSRSRDWLKFKCSNEQELVVGGYTDPQGTRIGFGALLLGYFDESGELRYAGKVGTGFDEDTLQSLSKRLEGLAIKRPAFVNEEDLPNAGIHWVRPELVGQIAFTEWTRANRLRHPRFLGLRREREAKDVVLERPTS